MDTTRFDSLTGRLSDPQSRRGLLGSARRGMVVGVAVLTGASLGLDEKTAKAGKRRNPCKEGKGRRRGGGKRC